MEFYVYLNGAPRGPFTREQLQENLAGGLLQASDLVSDRADGEWQPLARLDAPSSAPQMPSLAGAPPSPAPTISRIDSPGLPTATLGPYARSTLAPNETPYFKTSLHWIVFVRFAVGALLVFLLLALPFAIGVQALFGSELGWFALPLPAFLMLTPTLAWISSELVITDRRVLIKTGIVRRQTLEMFISKVESIAIEQSFLGRIFDYGSVTIRGTGGLEEPFEAIAHPIQFRNWVQRVQHQSESSSSR